MNLRQWFRNHSLRILAIRDTPDALAGGVAIGIFFGFMPLPGVKTLSSIFCAWLTRANILAAVIAGSLHDVLFPLMPALYLWEYKLGFWILSSPHHWPPALHKAHWEGPLWHFWHLLMSLGKPLFLGGLICSTPAAAVAFFLTRRIVSRNQQRHKAAAIGHPTGNRSTEERGS